MKSSDEARRSTARKHNALAQNKLTDRRSAVKAIASLSVSMMWPTLGVANAPQPIIVDTDNVTDLAGLLSAIKRAGASVLPSELHDHLMLDGIARGFVRHSHEVLEQFKSKIPEQIRRRMTDLPRKRWSPEAITAGVVVTVLGIAFLIPKAVLATVVLASLTVMTAYIVQAIKDMESDRAKDYI